jgi:transposase InsO family protein
MPWRRSVEEDRRLFLEDFTRADVNRRGVCRVHGISPKTGYELWRRYRAEGESALRERSRRPHHSPRRLELTQEQRILEIREDNGWGPRKIRWQLEQEGWPGIAARSTIEAVLRRNGKITHEERHSRTIQRFEHAEPNQLWQMDFKGHFALHSGHRCHPLTILDDHARYLIELHACADERRGTVRARLELRFRENGMPEAILADNGGPWGSAGSKGYTELEVWLLRLEIKLHHGRIRHPQTQGKVERLHRTLGEEMDLDFLDQAHAQQEFDRYRQLYNQERPHEAIGMQVPASRYRRSIREYPEKLRTVEYDAADEVRSVDDQGKFSFRGRRCRIGRAFAGQRVAIRPGASDGMVDVYFCRSRVGSIDLRGGRSGG